MNIKIDNFSALHASQAHPQAPNPPWVVHGTVSVYARAFEEHLKELRGIIFIIQSEKVTKIIHRDVGHKSRHNFTSASNLVHNRQHYFNTLKRFHFCCFLSQRLLKLLPELLQKRRQLIGRIELVHHCRKAIDHWRTIKHYSQHGSSVRLFPLSFCIPM